MASYKDKVNQKKLSTESGKIAWCIKWLDRDWKLRRDATRDGIPLYDDVSIRESSSEFIWVVTKPVEFKPNRCLCKYVQQYLTWEQSKKMLDAQPWQYI